MNQSVKIITSIIITAIIVGVGVYYWQNSKTPFQEPPISESEDIATELSITAEPVKQPVEDINDTMEELEDSTDETANWKNYTSMGINIKYPNDGTYTINEEGPDPSVEGFTIAQEYPGNIIHIIKTTDSSVIQGELTTKVISGKTFKEFHLEGMGAGYGYVIERNGEYYKFLSVWGPENEVFELMMTTVEFE